MNGKENSKPTSFSSYGDVNALTLDLPRIHVRGRSWFFPCRRMTVQNKDLCPAAKLIDLYQELLEVLSM
jgi:hypothetical protein